MTQSEIISKNSKFVDESLPLFQLKASGATLSESQTIVNY